MNLLDRYIARQFLINVLALLAILAGFVITIDVSLKLDEFVEAADALIRQEAAEPPGTLRRTLLTILIVLDLWWPRLLVLFNYLVGMVMVAAMGFTCAQLSRHREFIAILSSGQSLHRVLRPVLVVALGVCAVQAVNQEVFIPRVAPRLTRDAGDAGRRNLGVLQVPLTDDGRGRLLYAREFDADAGRLRGLFIIERDGQGHPMSVVRAASATWRDGGWDLVDGWAESRAANQPAGRLPTQTPLPRLDTSLDPTRLKMHRYRAYKQALSFAQATQLLRHPELLNQGARDEIERIRWGRVSVMASNVLSLLIAAPFFLNRRPDGLLGRSLRCAPVAGAALLGGVMGSSAAIPGLPAWLGAFVPAVLLAPVAIACVSSVRT